MMLKLTKKWKPTKFFAPSAAVYVASVMVNDDWGGGYSSLQTPKLLEKSKNWKHSPLQLISGEYSPIYPHLFSAF